MGSSTTRFALACNSSEKIIEPIQSRCAMLRYSKLTDAQVLAKVLTVCEAEGVDHSEDGLEAVVFTAQGDMRQALNNLQSTHEGFGFVKSENVFKVCDEPHPLLVKDMLDHATKADIDEAYKILAHLWELGYSPEDIITNVFRVCKSHSMAEFLKLEFIKEIGRTHLAMAQGTSSLLQLSGMLARLCQVSPTFTEVGQPAWVAGWGATDPESTDRPKILQAVEVAVIDSKDCEAWHRARGIKLTLYKEMVCAGHKEGGRDACQGDSGGPLMTRDDSGQWRLIGLVSAGYSCAKPGQPGIYHRLAETLPWLKSVINS